jgi:phosphonate transport system ATP-binding protein
LVATLHQVDMALAHFPRIIGLREGQLVFDLPAAQVTPERLARLYEQHEHELRGEAPLLGADTQAQIGSLPEAAAPVAMHCR